MALRLWLRHRRLALTAGVFLAALAVFVGIRLTRPAMATSGGDPYSVPLIVDTNPDPNIVETTIVADEATVDIGNGVMAHAQTFNGQLPGPEFMLKVGNTVIVHFENHLDHPTGIHWHGIELANASDGTPLTQNQVPPGGSFLYKFKVTRPGIYWYHPHHHSSTNQVFKGLYGPIVIKDPNETFLMASGTLPLPSQTLTLALSDITVCKAPGTNDTRTYPASAPWIGGSPLPDQGTPPVSLCETSAVDEDGMSRGAFAAGDIPNIQRNTGGRENEGQTVLTNGKNVGGRAGTPSAPGALDAGASTFDVRPGQGLRLRLGNTAIIRFFRLRLTDNSGTQIPLVRVGGQGGLLDNAVVEGGIIAGFNTKISSGEIQLDPGDRADVVAAIPASATGVLTLWTEDMERTGMGFSNIPTVPVAHFNVTGSAVGPYSISAGTALRAATGDPVPTLGGPTAVLLNPATFTPAKPGLSSQDVKLQAGSIPNIDGVTGSHDFPGDYTAVPHEASARYAKLGDRLELTTNNTTAAHHPFHLHGFSIQPIRLDDNDPSDSDGTKPPYVWPYREFRDNIDVPPKYKLTYRVQLDDRALMDGVTPGGGLGRWVFHCHIFFHATLGMISEFDVVAPNGNERPYVNAGAVSVEVNEGQVASMNGTSADPDGDAVTYSASLGTVTNNGGGSWTWNYTTTDGPTESRFVYVTATDTGGRKDQAVFALKVDNLAPIVSISSPLNGGIVQLNQPFTLTAPFTDAGTGDTHTCSIAWGDSTTSPGVVTEAAGSGTCTATHAYTTAGFKTITATVTDDDGASGMALVTVDVNSPPDCNPVTPNPNTLWPPNHKFATITLSGATDPDGDTVTLTVTGVTQDEPVNGLGDGDTAPDARLVPGHSEQVDVRSERSGRGDGRFYHITFGGDDGRGGTCTATKNVTVRPNQHRPAIDSGLVFNSF
jgi:FtsP/CotA-like multicopper oxidase with cupredoxin domain